MNKQRKTSHILNVFQYDETTGAVTLPSTLVLSAPASNDNSTKVPTTAWTRTYVSSFSYLTGNQSISITGDATGSGTTSIALTLANTAVTAGTYGSSSLVPVVTVDSKGRITSVTTASISGALTFTGDVTGSGTTGSSTGLTLAASGVTAGTYTKVTVDTKGRVTVGASATTSDIAEGTNLYYTDARVLAYLAANNYATQTYVGTQIANLVASAPATLDTLNELAAALGNDPSFATTVATSIGTKQAQLNGTGFVKVTGTTVSYDNSTYYLASNPNSYITGISFANVSSKPTTLAGYGITDAASSTHNHDSVYVSLTGSYANPSWITSLAYSKITGVPAFLTSYTETDPYRVTTVAVSGTSTKTITLTRADSSTVTTTWTDIDTDTNTYATSLGFSGGTLTLTNNNATTVTVSLDGRYYLASNPSGYISSYTETDTLATVTGRGSSTTASISAANFQAAYQVLNLNTNKTPGLYNYDGGIGGTQPLGTEWYNVRTIEIGTGTRYSQFVMPYSATRIFYRIQTDSGFQSYVELYHTGNLTNLNQLTNGPGYITSYSETDTLATVTGRGATTSTETTYYGGLRTRKSQTAGNYTTAALWTESYDNTATGIAFHISGVKGTFLEMRTNQILYWDGNTVLHSGNYNSYSPTLTGTGASGTWGISITGNAATATYATNSTRLYASDSPYTYGGAAPYYMSMTFDGTHWRLQVAPATPSTVRVHTADTLTGYAPNQTGGANTIVQRDANGYIQNSYFYTSGGGTERNSSGLGYIAGFNSSDYYIRSYNSSAVASFLGLGSLAYASILSDTGYNRITNPGGGSYVTQASSVTGAIRVLLPTQGSAMMMTCTVKVYEYTVNKSFTITFGGHRDSNNWYNEFCYLDGDSARGNLTVRFGVDSGKDCVYIGETSSVWSYPQVFVTDVQLGYAGYSATWLTGWNVSFVTSFSTVNRTQTAYSKITTGNIGSQSVSYATTSGTASNLQAVDATQIRFNSVTNTDYSTMTFMSRAWSSVQGANGLAYNFTTHTNGGSGGYGALQIYYGESGYVLAPTSFRAPIFYDSNDTGYYLDPNSTSNLNAINMVGQLNLFGGAYFGTIRFGSNSYWACGISQRDAANAEMRIWAKGGGSGSIYFATGYDGESSSTTLPTDGMALKNNNLGLGSWGVSEFPSYKLHVKGTGYATSDFRAPIFYDSNDTSYYVDPNGTSNLQQITWETSARIGRPYYWTNRLSKTGAQGHQTGTNGWGMDEGGWDTAWKGGFSGWDIWGGSTGHPQGSGYVHAQGIVSGLHHTASDGSNAYGWMMVGAHNATDNRYWLRGKWSNSVSGWVEMITTGNIGSQSVSYATSAGNAATATGQQSGVNFTLNTGGAGYGLVGVYNADVHQGFFAMGAAYVLGAGGTLANFYGVSWSYDYSGRQLNTGYNLQHCMAVANAGVVATVIGLGIWTSGLIRANGAISAGGTITGSNLSGTNTGDQTNISGNAATAGGLSVHSGRNNEANKIVRTDANGYIQAGWINSDSGNMGFETRIARIQCSNDNYIRFQTLTEFKVSLGLSGKNVHSRRVDYTSDANYHVGSFGHGGVSTNEVFHYGSGFYDVWGGGGTFPGSMTHIHGFNALHYSTGNGGNAYGWQMASQYDRPGEYYARNVSGGSFSSWRQFITSDNIGSQKADGALKLWATSHPNDYYIVNNWTGSHWRLTSNHGSPVRVGYADDVGSINSAIGNTYYWTGINYFQTNNGGSAVNNSSTASLEAYSTGNNTAYMSFHRGGYYAINMGLDNDNVFRIGGWSASGNRLQMDMSGNLTMAGDITAYSDARIKENIISVDNALSKVLALRGVYYNRIDSDDKSRKIGVIAQETLQVVPEVVNQDGDGMFNVSYGNLAGLFIEAFKEQDTIIKDQTEVIKGLQEQIDVLKFLVDGLTK